MAAPEEFSSEGEAILQRILAHRRGLPIREIEVPEWGASADEPLVIYLHALSVDDARALQEASGGNHWTGYVEAIVRFARDEDGRRYFKRTQIQKLARGGSRDVVERVGSFLISHYRRTELMEPLEETVGNSSAGPSSS